MALLAVVVGVPGVGKSSVASAAIEKGWKLVNFGDVMFEIAKEKYGISHRDEMRLKIPPSEYPKLQEEAARKIAAMEGKVILDTHCTVYKPEGYYPGLPMNILQILKPKAFILIEAPPEDIIQRREKDAAVRKRFEDPKEQQELNRYFAAAYCAISGASLAIIKNLQGRLDEARRHFLEILEALEK